MRWRKFIPFTQKIFEALVDLQTLSMHLWHIGPPERGLAPVPINRSVVLAVSETFPGRQQPQIEFVFLTARLIFFPAANIDNCLFAPKDRTRLRQKPAREQNPRITRLRNRKQLALGILLIEMLHRHRTENNVCVWVRGEKIQLPLNLVRQQIIVSVQILQPLAASKLEQPIASRIAAAVRPD